MTLESQIMEDVRRWLRAQAVRVRDENVSSTIAFTISCPTCDEGCEDGDGSLCLSLHVEETTERLDGEEAGLRVPSVRWDPSEDPS